MVAKSDHRLILLWFAWNLRLCSQGRAVGERGSLRAIDAWPRGWRRPLTRFGALPPAVSRPRGSVRVGCAGTLTVVGPDRPAGSAPSSLLIYELGGLYPVDSEQRNFLADQFDDRGDRRTILGCREHKRTTFPAGAAGTAYAMHIILGMAWCVDAENVAQALDVQAPGGNIAGNEEPDLTISKAVQGLCPFRLRHVAVQRGGIKTVAG